MIRKVIIVDDNKAFVNMLANNMPWAQMGLELVAVHFQGGTALADIRRFRPDLVITDINMPDTDGLQLIRETQSLLPKTRFILITAYDSFQYAYQALKLHAYDFLLKPFTREELKRVLCRAVEEMRGEGNEPASQYTSLTQAVIDYIRLHLAEPITLDKIATHLQRSPTSLTRELKRNANIHFSELLTQIRIEKAEELLNNPEVRVTEIAEKVGYKNYITFYKVFIRVKGISPTACRRSSADEDTL